MDAAQSPRMAFLCDTITIIHISNIIQYNKGLATHSWWILICHLSVCIKKYIALLIYFFVLPLTEIYLFIGGSKILLVVQVVFYWKNELLHFRNMIKLNWIKFFLNCMFIENCSFNYNNTHLEVVNVNVKLRL